MNIETNIKQKEFNQIEYIRNNGIDRNPASIRNRERLSLVNKMIELEQDNRTLFHLTVTYKQYQNRTYTESDINTFFDNFYCRTFLTALFETRNIHKKKSIQPISYCFLDEHEHNAKPKAVMNTLTNRLETIYSFPVRLHHHVIIAAHTDTLSKMNSLCGISTIPRNKWSNKVMTTCINKCDSNRILYSSKMYSKFPDFLIYPPFNVTDR